MSSQSNQHGERITPIDTDSEEATSRVEEGENSQQRVRSRTCARRGDAPSATTPVQGSQVRDVLQSIQLQSRSASSSREVSPASRGDRVDRTTFTMEQLELLHDMFAHGRITFKLMQQVMNLLVWIGGNGILTVTARRDQAEPAEGESSAPADRAGQFEERPIMLTNNVIIGDDVVTGQTHSRANPIYQERRHRTSTSFDLSTIRSTGRPAKGIQPCGKRPDNPTCSENKRIAEAKLRRKKPLRAMEAMVQHQMVGRSTVAETQTPTVQTAEVAIQEVATVAKADTQTNEELSDEELTTMGVHPLYWAKVRRSTFLAVAMKGFLPTDDEVMKSMNQTVDPLRTQAISEPEEVTLAEETRVDLDMRIPEEEDETLLYGETAVPEQLVTTTEEEHEEVAPLDMSTELSGDEASATVVENPQEPPAETQVRPAHDVTVLPDGNGEEQLREVERPEARTREQSAGWTSDESEEELPRVLPFRERRQAPTFQMIVGRE